MNTPVIIRFAALGIAWLATVGLLIARAGRITPYLIFIIIASAIIVFVPMYKKYVKNGSDKK